MDINSVCFIDYNSMESVVTFMIIFIMTPCLVGLVVSVSASDTVGHGFVSRPGHTNCLPAWHAVR